MLCVTRYNTHGMNICMSFSHINVKQIVRAYIGFHLCPQHCTWMDCCNLSSISAISNTTSFAIDTPNDPCCFTVNLISFGWNSWAPIGEGRPVALCSSWDGSRFGIGPLDGVTIDLWMTISLHRGSKECRVSRPLSRFTSHGVLIDFRPGISSIDQFEPRTGCHFSAGATEVSTSIFNLVAGRCWLRCPLFDPNFTVNDRWAVFLGEAPGSAARHTVCDPRHLNVRHGCGVHDAWRGDMASGATTST